MALGGAATAKSLQSCLTLHDPIDGSPPGSPIPGILQARTMEWVAISFSNAWKVKVKSLSRARLSATPWTGAHQAPPSMWSSRQEYWSGVPTGNKQVMEKAIARQLCAAEGRKHMCMVLGLPATVFRNLSGEQWTIPPTPGKWSAMETGGRRGAQGRISTHAHSSSPHGVCLVSGRTADKPEQRRGAEDKSLQEWRGQVGRRAGGGSDQGGWPLKQGNSEQWKREGEAAQIPGAGLALGPNPAFSC